ncbi:MAG: HTH domain-containing protein [Bacteroidales bacterium]|jgi:predicted DNA-binding transcriptional regulator YafY|nr:HTH domain-containing protein [Bacteroidales bacterium]
MKNYEASLELIERTDRLVRLHATGTASQLADTLCISRVSVFRLLKYLKTMGAPIKYCKYRKTYYYEHLETFARQMLI